MSGARTLTGPRKAATLMLALGEEQAAKIFGQLHEDEIRDLSASMAGLGTVSSVQVEEVVREFTTLFGQTGGLVGSYDATERLLLKTLPRERVTQIMEEIRGPAGRTMWDKLGNVNEAVLANYLKNEYPQTVAVVLSKVKPDHAARVLSLLPEAFAMEVVMRMLRMETVQKEALDGVERTLRSEFMSNLARGQRRDAHEVMAEIFNNLDRAAETRILTALEHGTAGLDLTLAITSTWRRRLIADGRGDLLDAVICGLQAAHASALPRYGLPHPLDPLEGWIASVPTARTP